MTHSRSLRAVMSLGLLCCLLPAALSMADPLRIFAAGSLSGTMGDLVAAAGLAPVSVAPVVFGPAGLLRQRIEGGEPADLFASADLAQPEHLAGRPGVLVVPFARNRTCALAAGSLGLDRGNLLDRMLDPAIRIATSTPGADPGGDYAQAVFARAETVHRGAQAMLQAKAQALFGGPAAMVPTDGHTPGGAILLSKRADIVLYYCSSAPAVLAEVPGAVAVPVPDALEPGPVYGLAVWTGNPDAARLALFMLSAPGQAILAQHGLLPLIASNEAVAVAGPGGAPTQAAVSDLRALPAMTADLAVERGAARHMAGPTLWSVLQNAGAIEPDFHKRVRQVVTVTGRDGYSVTLGMGEIDPEFENKPVLLALDQDGAALAQPRLVVPADKRPGRSVRDVASITVGLSR